MSGVIIAHCNDVFCCGFIACTCQCPGCLAAVKHEALEDCRPCFGTGIDLHKPKLSCGCRPSCEACHGMGKKRES